MLISGLDFNEDVRLSLRLRDSTDSLFLSLDILDEVVFFPSNVDELLYWMAFLGDEINGKLSPLECLHK